jgi:galactose oxidase
MGGGIVYIDKDTLFHVGGSENYDKGPGSNRAYIIDISNSSHPIVTRQPDATWKRVFVNLVVLPDGCIVLAGGQAMVELFVDDYGIKTMEIYCPATQTWSRLATPLQTVRPYHSSAVLDKYGRVWVGGGGLCGGCDNHPSVEIITPPYLLASDGVSLAPRPSIMDAPTTFLPNDLIKVTMDTGTPHTFAITRLGTATHATNLDQRRVSLTVASQDERDFYLQMPPNPVHVPAGPYWLFAMNEAGVPSVGWELVGLMHTR